MISDGKFGRNEHILKSADFARVYKKGRASRKNSIILYYLPNGLSHNRIGFSISSKSVKKASSRNRMRRLFREAYRLRRQDFNRGFDMVLVFKREMARTVPYKEAEDIFLMLAGSAGILNSR